MGRKSRAKKERITNIEATPFSRRKFLGTCGVLGMAYLGWSTLSTSQWAFLEPVYLPDPHATEKDIKKSCIPMGKPFSINENSAAFNTIQQEVNPLLFEEMQNSGFDPHGEYGVTATRQHYGIPDTKERSASLQHYCELATRYVDEHPEIGDLVRTNIEWISLKPGQDFSNDYYQRGFIGVAHYQIEKIKVVHKNKFHQQFTLTRVRYEDNSFLMLEENSLLQWYISVASAKPMVSLKGPFSELLPLTTEEATNRYAQSVGYDASIIAAETITESLSHLLSLELVRKLDITGAPEIIENSIQGMMDPRYFHLQKAIQWTRNNGMRNALELYLEKPGEFMTKVKNV